MKLRMHLIFSVSFFLFVIVMGAVAYYYVEGWSKLDSLYFVIITTTTIGYGDLVPVSVAGKIFTMFYSLFGVSMALYLLSTIGGYIFKKHVGKKVSEIKKEVKEQQEIKKEIHSQIEDIVQKSKNTKKKR